MADNAWSEQAESIAKLEAKFDLRTGATLRIEGPGASAIRSRVRRLICRRRVLPTSPVLTPGYSSFDGRWLVGENMIRRKAPRLNTLLHSLRAPRGNKAAWRCSCCSLIVHRECDQVSRDRHVGLKEETRLQSFAFRSSVGHGPRRGQHRRGPYGSRVVVVVPPSWLRSEQQRA